MKKLLLILLVFTLFSCETKPPTETEIYLYFDFTEGQDYSERIEEDVMAYLELMEVGDMSSSNFGKIKVYPLYDVGSARGKTIKLKEGKSEMESNKFLRKKEVEKFRGQLVDFLTEVNGEYTGKSLDKSHIFAPICKGISKLNGSDADRKIILIYSDMLENSDIANLHAKTANFEKWTAAFDEACDLEDVSDLEFYIVHPVDKNNDSKIQIAADFWSNYLMDKGLDEDGFHFDTGIDL